MNLNFCNDICTLHINSHFSRGRRTETHNCQYEFEISTLKTYPSYITAEILNKENGHLFVFTLTALKDNTFQVLIDEKTPLHKRYRTEHVLNGTPKNGILKVESKSENEVIVSSGKNKVIIQAWPLKVDFYRDELLAVSVNEKGLIKIEHLRTKPAE